MPGVRQLSIALLALAGAFMAGMLTLGALPVAAQSEAVDRFAAEYRVAPDGTVAVRETITYDFQGAQRHGIFRTITRTHPEASGQWFRERILEVTIEGVERGGVPAPFSVRRDADAVTVRIGDPETTVTGQQVYTLTYTLAGALSYDGATELYVNVTGDAWEVPIRQVEAAVYATGTTVLADALACYAGPAGAQASCSLATSTGTGTVFRQNGLAPGEQLTIAQALVPGTVAVSTEVRWQLGWLLVPALVFATILLTIFGYRLRTRHRPNQAIIARYEPYGGLLPMYTGVVLDGALHPRDITAGVVYLAEQGFLKIRHVSETRLWIFTSGDYELTLLRPIEEAPNEASRDVLRLIFAESKAGERDGGDSETVRLSAVAAQKQRNAKRIQALRRRFKKQLNEQGYFERATLSRGAYTAAGAVLGLLAVGALFVAPGALVPLCVLAIGASVIIFSPRRSAKGYAARWHLLGFKDFLSVTGTDRFAFHNAPERNPELFLQYLPYAIALGVEKEWAEVFGDLTIAAPLWYESETGSTFSASAFAGDMGSFASSFSAASGSSGSSGGGSAGGGAGGGGGGSW